METIQTQPKPQTEIQPAADLSRPELTEHASQMPAVPGFEGEDLAAKRKLEVMAAISRDKRHYPSEHDPAFHNN